MSSTALGAGKTEGLKYLEFDLVVDTHTGEQIIAMQNDEHYR